MIMRTIVVGAVCLVAGVLPAQKKNHKLHSFRTVQLEKGFYCEGATFGDLNRDRCMDLISGPYWYEGPDFKQRHEIYQPRVFDTKRYSNNFFAFVYDFNKDGWQDIFFIGFPGKDASWFENPKAKGAAGHWQRHQVFRAVDNESPTFADLDGDGKPELVCQSGDRMGWAAPDWSDPTRAWEFHPISVKGVGGRFSHGLGVGDVNGDGRRDILWRHGWWEQPESLEGDPPWKSHLFNFAGRGGAQMYAYDVDGDGDNDVISSFNAHGYGLYWYEHVVKEGKITFRRHRIMGSRPGHSRYRVVFGNLHAVDLVDMDGDGLQDIVTGNRYFAHGGRDKADRGKAPLYWFKLVRTGVGEGAHFVPHEIHGHSGVGTQVVAGDVNGDGLPDVVVGNKMGTFVHLHDVKMVTRDEWFRVRRNTITTGIAEDGAASMDRTGPVPVGADGSRLNLDFETGDLRHWKATGTAFSKMPVKGDTIYARRDDSRSRHAGDYWVGTYETERSDKPTGSLTSDRFKVTQPFVSFLVGGGRSDRTRVELVLASNNEIIRRISGRNRENMHAESVDLRKYVGKEIYIRLVDEDSGRWGHINFDDFRFHAKNPVAASVAGKAAKPTAARVNQTQGFLPREAVKRMTVPEGFHVDLVAGEPDLHQPIAFTIDERGRLWVAEAFAYPKRKPKGKGTDKIVVFEDTKGDGSFDKRTVFADNLNLVSGLEVGFGGVWVGAAPYLLFIPDKDNDLKPDGDPVKLLDGWGYQDTHETLNAFIWGPDGWLYGCHGVYTHSNVGKPGTPKADRAKINAGVWRYHPTKHRFEVFAWGTSNPWGVDFDDHGQAFITACVIPHLYHIIQGGRYHRQSRQHFNKYVFDDIKTIADHVHYLGSKPHAGNTISDSVGGGHAHCGAMIYLGDAFPDQYRGTIFMGNIHGNRINTDILRREGSGFVGSHGDDFLLANDKWFRGIDLKYGPDGNVYLIDWYDKQACHKRRPEVWDRTNGRLYKITWGQPKTVTVDLASLSNKALVAMQLHKNDWFVRTSRRILQQRGGNADVHRGLTSILRENKDVSRKLRALWTLHVTAGVTEELALEQLSSSEEYVRAWTIQLLLEDKSASGSVQKRLAEMARTDSSPVVRLYLASASQQLPHQDRWAIAEGLAARSDEGDHNLPLMVWYGVEPLVPEDAERALRLAGSTGMPTVARHVYRRMASGKNPDVDALVRTVAGLGDDRRKLMILDQMLIALKKRSKVAMPTGWPPVFARVVKSRNRKLRERALTLAVIFGDMEVRPQVRQTLADTDADTARRRWALDTLLRVKDSGLVPVLQQLIDDPAVGERAIRGLASFDDAKTPQLILDRYQILRQSEQKAAVRTLTSRASYTKALLGAILKKQVPSTVLDSATTRRQIQKLKNKEIDQLMEVAWGRSTSTAKDKRKLIDSYKKKLPAHERERADLSHGRAVFSKTCMACHKLFGVGGNLGPDITGGGRADLDFILENIIDPSAEVSKEYMMTTVETKDGGLSAGMISEENDETITLRNAAETKVIAIKDIKKNAQGKLEITRSATSMMPEGQLLALNHKEVRDLIGYLASDRQVPMTATDYNLPLFYNNEDLAGWDADPAIWSVRNGEIVGKTAAGLKKNDFARSHMLLGDFRLILEVKLIGDRGNSGIQFWSKATDAGGMKGYQADIGKGWWGKLYEEHGRGLLWKKSGDDHVRVGGWNTYEILAIGNRVRTAINGKLCVDLKDDEGARKGVIGLQVHSGGPTEVRFRELDLELKPKPELKTVR